MVRIRAISTPELFKVETIARATWPSTFAGILSSQQIEYMLNWMYDLRLLSSQLEAGYTFLLAEEEDQALGFAVYQSNAVEATTKLHKLYVLPTHHGKGIGKSLLQEVVQRARLGVQEAVVLNVNKFNRKAIDFYLSMDFTIAQEEVIDIGNGYVMDDYVMRKDFSTP